MTAASRVKLADWMRRRLGDNQRFLVLCIACGLLCGLAAVSFHLAISHLFHGLWDFAEGRGSAQLVAIMLVAPTFAGLLVGVAVRFFAPDAAGSGIPQTKEAYYNRGGVVSAAAGLWRFVLGALYVGLGNSLGREGPTVHFSAAIASKLGRWAFKKPERVQAMLPVGMAAGIAAAFNAPLSALTFVFEELLDHFSMKALGGMVIAVVLAAAVSRTILGEDPVLPAGLVEDYQTSAWMLVALPLGFAAGVIGLAFVRATLLVRGWVRNHMPLPTWLRPASGGLACGVLGLTAFYLTGLLGNARNSVFSIGYESLDLAFVNQLSASVLLVLLVFKVIAVVLNYASGGSGGLFSPVLLIGGMLGGLIGLALTATQEFHPWIAGFPSESSVVGGCVLLGMGAMFAAVVQCPFTSLIIIFEMTGNYSLILPLMGGNILAWQIARRFQPVSLYNALLLQDGVSLRTMPAYQGAQDYRCMPVQAIMTMDLEILRADAIAGETIRGLGVRGVRYHAFPVVNSADQLVGVVTWQQLLHAEPGQAISTLVAEQQLLTVFPSTTVHEAANQMISHGYRQVPVVGPRRPQHLMGWLTINDIARQQNISDP